MKYIVSSKYENNSQVYEKIGYKTIKECLKVCKPGDYIYLCNECYNEKLTIRCRDLTIIGMDDTIITYDAYHSLKIRECDGGDGEKVYGTSGSSTILVTNEASGFKMYNVCVENGHKIIAGEKNQAVAFKTEAQKGYFEECKFLGYQDTLYIDNSDNVFYNCLIAGSVDFIFGRGDTIIDRCSIVIRGKDANKGYIVAPNTPAVNSYGIFIYKCNITIEGECEAYLGRPWFDIGLKETALMPRALFYKCNFPSNLSTSFVKMKDIHSDNYEMFFYDCFYRGINVSSLKDDRIVDFYEKIYNQRRY